MKNLSLKEQVIQLLFNNACQKGQYATMRPTDIGRGIETYRLEYVSRSIDPVSRIHYDILKELEREKRIECVWNERHTRRKWRLTEAEWDRLISLNNT